MYLQLIFQNMGDLYAVRTALSPVIVENRRKLDTADLYAQIAHTEDDMEDLVAASRGRGVVNALDNIIDIREFDIPYHVRVAIDLGKCF